MPTTALAARTSQEAILAGVVGQSAVRSSSLVMLSAYAPPATKIARVSQEVILALSSAEGNVVVRNSQIVELIAYQTGVPTPKRSRAWTFVLDGHTFYVLDIGTEGTFLYDMVTDQWCNFSTQGFEPQWNFQNGTMWGTRIIGADLLTDDIWEMIPTGVVDEGWRDIAHIVTGGLPTRSRVYLPVNAVRVDASFGILDQVNGSVMRLRYSDDQEETWSDYFDVDLINDDFDGEVAYRSLGSFMAPGRIFELSDSGGLIRINALDAFIENFDDDQPKPSGG